MVDVFFFCAKYRMEICPFFRTLTLQVWVSFEVRSFETINFLAAVKFCKNYDFPTLKRKSWFLKSGNCSDGSISTFSRTHEFRGTDCLFSCWQYLIQSLHFRSINWFPFFFLNKCKERLFFCKCSSCNDVILPPGVNKNSKREIEKSKLAGVLTSLCVPSMKGWMRDTQTENNCVNQIKIVIN